MNIKVKRVYEEPDEADGFRILVDRLWPRGVSKQNARIDYWPKELAPSTELRRWYGHAPEKWPDFKSRYFAELDSQPDLVSRLLEYLGDDTVTFIFSSKEERLNNAFALREYVSLLRK